MSKSTLEELEKFANDRVLNAEARGVLFKKLAASGMDRKTVNKMLSDAQKAFSKARQRYTDSNSRLEGLQQEVDSAQQEMSAARSTMMEIHRASQTMDLTGAEGLRQEKGGEYSYIIEGDRHHADTSDFENIKLTPWKEYSASKKSEENDDVSIDLVDEINMSLTSEDVAEPSDDEEKDREEVSERDSVYFEDDVETGDSEEDRFSSEKDAPPTFDPFAFEAASSVEKSIITKVAKKKFR